MSQPEKVNALPDAWDFGRGTFGTIIGCMGYVFELVNGQWVGAIAAFILTLYGLWILRDSWLSFKSHIEYLCRDSTQELEP